MEHETTQGVEIRDVHITRPTTYVEHETTQEVETREVHIVTLTKPRLVSIHSLN